MMMASVTRVLMCVFLLCCAVLCVWFDCVLICAFRHYLLNPFDELNCSPDPASTEPAAGSQFQEPRAATARLATAAGPGVPRARFPSAPSSAPSPYSSSGRVRGQRVARVVPVRVSFERYFAEEMKNAKGDTQMAFGPRAEQEDADEQELAAENADAGQDSVGEGEDAFDRSSGVLQTEASASSSNRVSTRASTVASPLSPRSRRMSQDGGGGGAMDSRAAKDPLVQSLPPPAPAPARPRSYADVESTRVGVLPPSKALQYQQTLAYSSIGGKKSGVSFAGHGSKHGSKRASGRASGGMVQVQLSTAAKAAAAAAATAAPSATSIIPARSTTAASLPPRPVASPPVAAAGPIHTGASQQSSRPGASISDGDDDDDQAAYEDDADFAALESEAAATHALHHSSRPTSSKTGYPAHAPVTPLVQDQHANYTADAHAHAMPPAEDVEVELEYHDDDEAGYLDDAEAAATFAEHAAQQWALTPVAHDPESVIAEEDPEAEYAEEWN